MPPNRPPDFKARIRFLRRESGTRGTVRTQGYRCDFRYPDDEPGHAWMIWPWFLDHTGEPLPEGTPIPLEADAEMYILNPELGDTVHRRRIRTGLGFELVEGTRPVAESRVTELLALGGAV